MAKQSFPLLCDTVRATGAITAHRFVSPAAAQVVADGPAVGVARFTVASGELLTIDCKGTTVIESGAAITAGVIVKSDASGRAIAWATSGAKLGRAKEAATAAGQFIEMTLLDHAE